MNRSDGPPAQVLPAGLSRRLEDAVTGGVCSAAALGVVLADGRRFLGCHGHTSAWRGPPTASGWRADMGPEVRLASL